MVSFNFDFAPNKSPRQVIKEAQEKAREEVIKEIVRQEIKKAPSGTPLNSVTAKVNNLIYTPDVGQPVAQTLPATPQMTNPPQAAYQDRLEEAANQGASPIVAQNIAANTTPSVSNENTTTSSGDYESQVPEAAGTKEEALQKTQENRDAVVETEEGSATDEEVQKVYDGITFDFAPGQDPQEVIEAAQAGEDLQAPTGGSSDFTERIFPTPDDFYGGPSDPPENTGGGGEPLAELTSYAQGGTWYAVTGYPGLPVAYFVEYTLPGGNKIYYFADRKDLDTLEGIGMGKEPPIVSTVAYSDFKQGRVFGGSISDVVGTNEHYSTRVERTLMAPTGDLLLPTWANNDAEIKDLFYIAVAESWSDTKFLREMSKKNSFKERYPAFQDMLALTGGDHAQALVNYQGYERKVRELNNRYGESADAQALAAEAIKKGFTLDDLQATYDIFERAEQNSDAMLAFQKVINAEGLDFDLNSPQGIVDFFKGAAPTEIYDLYEASSITEQASKLKLDDLSVDEALEIARNTPGQLTNQQVSAALQSAAQTLLRYREYVDLGSYGLEADQIINLSLGYREPGGMTETELATALSRIYQTDENLQNLASGIAGSKTFQQKDRQIRSIG